MIGKRQRADVACFALHLTDNVFRLQQELAAKTYRHGLYQAFKVNDPKPRDIHKASVRDRLVHHTIYRVLYPYFDCQFIFNSYSCRKAKGTHRAIRRFADFANIVSDNRTHSCWILKCDIHKFFANIDHQILNNILCRHLDFDTHWLLGNIIDSFFTTGSDRAGLPLGNLTSQLLINIYMNEFDQFVKRVLKIKYYIRYADDFIILSSNRNELADLQLQISDFLNVHLKLALNPRKVQLKTLASGVDFLGWVHFTKHRIIRPTTRRRVMRRMGHSQKDKAYQSYVGLLKHGNTHKVRLKLDKKYWVDHTNLTHT